MELVHKTLVEDVPCALCPFQGRLLVTVGKVLRIYDLGKRKLLRKCEQKNFPNFLVSLSTTGDRIVAGDVAESFHFVKYKRHENQLNIFADDSIPRYCGHRPGPACAWLDRAWPRLHATAVAAASRGCSRSRHTGARGLGAIAGGLHPKPSLTTIPSPVRASALPLSV